MTTFFFLATVLVAIGLGLLLVPLLRERTGAGIDRAGANLGILQDQLADLRAERRSGALDEAQYEEARAELERRVLEEQHAEPAPPAAAAGSRPAAVAAWVLGLGLPVAAALLYAQLGNLGAFDPLLARAAAGDEAAAEPGDSLLSSLQQALERDPDNANARATLARALYAATRFDEAAQQYARLAAQFPDTADILADQADALAMARGRVLSGEPIALVRRALELDPEQWKALALSGSDAFERKDYPAAVDFWERLLRTLPEDAPIAGAIGERIAEARQLGGLAASAAGVAGPPARGAGAGAGGGAGAVAARTVAGAVSGTIRLGPEVAARADPADTVHIYARPLNGARMPLALTTVAVRDLPARFALDDSTLAEAGLSLANAGPIVVGARVSKSGRSVPAAGDLEGVSAPVEFGARDVAVTIDRVLP